MGKGEFLLNEANTTLPNWNSLNFGAQFQSNELNCSSEQLPNCFFNPNWENSMDQSDPFESALSSIVSSPAASNAGPVPGGSENIVIGELIGRLGSICNSGDISPQSYIGGNNSTNTSCYSTPLNSPPKLNLSMMDHQIRGNLPFTGNHFPSHPTFAPISADPGFAERAARLSCFGSRNFGGVNGQFGLNESELRYKLMTKTESGKLSRVSSNQSLQVVACQMGAQDSREESSVSEQIPGGEIGLKGRNDANSRKRKSVPRGKTKEIPSSPAKEAKAAPDNDESNAKRSKSDVSTENAEEDAAKAKAEATENGEEDAAKAKAEANGSSKTTGDGNQKQSKENPKPSEPPKDYIHVRARRGQATDSHSLAERVRREKISERMKFLQDLVPGCNKVTGKAVMLDEIINYVQSLQRQVEFLSMKLANVNPRMEFNMEALLSKDILQARGSLRHTVYPLDSSVSAFPYGFQSQQGPSLPTSISNGTQTQFSMNSFNAAAHRNNPTMHLPPMDGFGEATSQVSTFWEDDLQSVVQMGFGQN